MTKLSGYWLPCSNRVQRETLILTLALAITVHRDFTCNADFDISHVYITNSC